MVDRKLEAEKVQADKLHSLKGKIDQQYQDEPNCIELMQILCLKTWLRCCNKCRTGRFSLYKEKLIHKLGLIKTSSVSLKLSPGAHQLEQKFFFYLKGKPQTYSFQIGLWKGLWVSAQHVLH